MTNNNLIDSKLTEQRQKFPALKNKHYLNFGAQGTMPASAIDAIRQSYDYVQEHGPLSSSMFGWIQDQVLSTKQLLSEEFGAEPESYALTQNATEGCNIVLWGLDWQGGDVLLTTDSEHNGVMQAAVQLCKRRKLKLEICKLAELKNNDEILASVEKSLQCRPRLFMLSHVLWNTGRVLPLAEISQLCRSRGVQVLADGAQSAGVLPTSMDDLQVDFYALTGHKWLCGPEGIGALYVNPASSESLEPTFVGWRSAVFDSKGSAIEWIAGASRFEVATAPFPLLSGLVEAVRVHRQAGNTRERYELILANMQKLRSQLCQIPRLRLLDEEGGSSLLSFAIEGARHSEIVKRLESLRGIIVRTIPNPDCIRASVHYFSSEELDAFVQGLNELL